MHPLVRIVALVVFAIVLQLVKWQVLAVLGGLLAILAYLYGADVCRSLLRRARWLMLSILLIYAYATPGEFVKGLPDWISPTYEGLQAGLTQMGRLAVMLAALALLLATTKREGLMAGIYLLLQPLRILKFNPERFAARLWLTLHYVETMPQGLLQRLKAHGWRLEDILQEDVERPNNVEMIFPQFTLIDYVAIVVLLLLVWWLL